MKEQKRILVTGFPHCGTSILKSKLGECKNVYEQIDESVFPIEEEYEQYLNSDREFFLWKDPIIRFDLKRAGFGDKENTPYKNDIIIVILRNPYYALTTLLKRYRYPYESETHMINEYMISARLFLEAKHSNFENVYCIRYEDLFLDNQKEIKGIMDCIGLEYEDDIFDKKTKNYSMKKDAGLFPPLQGIDTGAYEYRNYQINQPFENFNQKRDIDIPDYFEKILKESPLITELGYNDIL
jgi:hypothetical protein